MYYANTEYDYSMIRQLIFLDSPDADIIGVTSGCFDLLHPLHIQYLEKCKIACDMLVVGVDCDALVLKNKKRNPVMGENERAYVVSSLSCVDYAFVMRDLEQLEGMLLDINGVFKKDKDQVVHLYKAKDQYYEKPVLQVKGVETIIIPDIYPISSTTELVRHIQTNYQRL